MTDARQSIAFADQSGDLFNQLVSNATAADALHQSGQRAEAGILFVNAERIQKERQPRFELLYSLPGFRYCDWLLAPADRSVWQSLMRNEDHGQEGLAIDCDEIECRGEYALDIVLNYSRALLDIALNKLTLARVGLFRAILNSSTLERQ